LLKDVYQENPNNKNLCKQIQKNFITYTSPNNKYTVAYEIENNTFILFDNQNQSYAGQLATNNTYIFDNFFSSDNKYFFALVGDTICVWELSQLNSHAPLKPVHTYQVKTSTQLYQSKSNIFYLDNNTFYEWDFDNTVKPKELDFLKEKLPCKMDNIQKIEKIKDSLYKIKVDNKIFFICTGNAEQMILYTILSKKQKPLLPIKIIVDNNANITTQIENCINKRINTLITN